MFSIFMWAVISHPYVLLYNPYVLKSIFFLCIHCRILPAYFKTLFKTHEIRRIFIGGFHPDTRIYHRGKPREARRTLLRLVYIQTNYRYPTQLSISHPFLDKCICGKFTHNKNIGNLSGRCRIQGMLHGNQNLQYTKIHWLQRSIRIEKSTIKNINIRYDYFIVCSKSFSIYFVMIFGSILVMFYFINICMQKFILYTMMQIHIP